MATKPTLAEFRTKFPELSGIADDAVTSAIDTAVQLIDVTHEAMIYASAHVAVLEDTERQTTPDGGSGLVSSEGEGPQRVSYINPMDYDAAWWGRTHYGRLALELRRVAPARIMSFKVL